VELGRTVEKYLTQGITKAAHHLIPFIGGNWVGLLKNTLTQVITKEQHITQSLLIGGNWVGLLKNTLTQGITKEQHIT
jgi:hypothetical protein